MFEHLPRTELDKFKDEPVYDEYFGPNFEGTKATHLEYSVDIHSHGVSSPLIDWIKKYGKDKWGWYFVSDDYTFDSHAFIAFKDKDDAALFKLTWG